AAVLEHYPDAKPTIGPAIDTGFYYDFDFGETTIKEDDLKKIEKTMRKLLPSWKEFSHQEVSANEARSHYTHNAYKTELINDLESEGATITLYTVGNFTDLCRGGHSENPAKDIAPDSFTLDKVAGAYWRGDEKNPMLTRIYGFAFENKEALAAHQARIAEAKERDHKKLGAELDLYVIDEQVGKGLPLWTPRGTIVKHALEDFARTLEKRYGYEHVETPYIGSEKLYRTSGHLDHYTSSMYAPIDMDGGKYYLRPMACPHHIRLLMRKPISYRDLPVRYAEVADYNRYEKSGELMGMIRVRKFELTDGHIFVSPEGLKEEFKNVCHLIEEGMRGLGLSDTVSYRFSKRDPNNKEKYYPDDALWNTAETTMREALDEIGFEYTEAEDEAAFYGPKLDVQAKNVNGKEDTLFTAQMDFLLPEKFNIEYTDKDGQKKRPVMIHRSTIGSLERVFAFLIEHYGGNFPLWLSPVQLRIIPVAEAHQEYARGIYDELTAVGLRVELDTENESLGKKIRNAKKDRLPYFAVIGDKEVDAKKITLESRDGSSRFETVNHLANDLLAEIENKG
ncbi:threonine--tRNA ligase, partial [Candidatus Kaiserbacteria bacterium]|nr:threonine--tRNA ligase [Candidatus Kaiserbacteria bacterium]